MDVKRYEGHRFLGLRDSMVVYDAHDDAQRAELIQRIDDDDLYERNLIQTFAPDTLAEARNRGFAANAATDTASSS